MTNSLAALEQDLRSLTMWSGPSPPQWKAAQSKHKKDSAVHKRAEIVVQVVVVGMIGLLLVGIFMPALGTARQSSRVLKEASEARMAELAGIAAMDRMGSGNSPSPAEQFLFDPASSRQIVRRAEIELSVTDLRDAYIKASDLIRPEFGEYIESSNYDARAYSPVARLKLRVTADRLDRALADLRSLGELTDESASGEDASARAIDLDARLANSRRIETELLELMGRRADADLADILQLRREIDDIRLQIERLEAQRSTLAELVSLATITVTLRADNEPDEPDQTFAILISESFDSGLANLSASAAWIVRIAVGGVIWWTIGLVSLALAIRWARRAGL